MSGLPDELWRQIIETGIKNSEFSYKDLCCLSISCRRLHRLSDESTFWSHLLSADFPSQNQQNPNPSDFTWTAKSAYKVRFEREREKKVTAHRRAVLRKQSEILERERKIREIQNRLYEESQKLSVTANELSNLHKVRQASVALNVWQPEIVRSRQKQVVEQSAVSVESRVHSLEMELKLCKQQIAGFHKAHEYEKQRLKKLKEELASITYRPLQDYRMATRAENGNKGKRKKLKTSADFAGKQGETSEGGRHEGRIVDRVWVSDA